MPVGNGCCAALEALPCGAPGAELRGTLPKAVMALAGARCAASLSTLSLPGAAAACLGCSGFCPFSGATLGCAFAGACLPPAFPLAAPAQHSMSESRLHPVGCPQALFYCYHPASSGPAHVEGARLLPLVDALLSETLRPANAARSCSLDS